MDVTINNQCTNIEPASLVYFIKDATCHIYLSQRVNINYMLKVNFRVGIDRDAFGGALLYRLQWKEDTSTCTQLLVIWGYKSNKLYSHTLPIEHVNTLVWDEDKLKKLYDVYNDRDHIHSISEWEVWLLDDVTILGTMCRISHGGFEMNVTISEERRLPLPKKSLWIDSNK
jgi:hypothetical protein